MNIPVEIARAQGLHGFKGGRPRLDLTDEERADRRRLQHEAYRRRKGVSPEKSVGPSRDSLGWWLGQSVNVWGRLWSVDRPLTPAEYLAAESRYVEWMGRNS